MCERAIADHPDRGNEMPTFADIAVKSIPVVRTKRELPDLPAGSRGRTTPPFISENGVDKPQGAEYLYVAGHSHREVEAFAASPSSPPGPGGAQRKEEKRHPFFGLV